MTRIHIEACIDDMDVQVFYNYWFERQSKYKIKKWDTILLSTSRLLAQIEVDDI